MGQASLAVAYTRRLNILKMITKDPRKAKALLKENENVLRGNETRLFGKKFRSHMIEIEKSKKKSLESFKDAGENKSGFRNAVEINCMVVGAIKPGNRDLHKKSLSPFQNNSRWKFQYESSDTQGNYLYRESKEVFFH